jgi:Ca-activated chloride channel family protein
MLLLSLPAAAQPAGDIPLFRSGVALVRVDVQVTSRHLRPVTGLAKEDFVIYDEGARQPVAYFGRDSEPLDLLLLLDVSGSMRRSLEEMAATAQLALRQLNGADRVAVMLFARQTDLCEPFTRDFARVQNGLREAVQERGLGSGTLINAAIISAAGHLAKQPPRGRRAILILTDNQGLNYQTPDELVLKALYAADTVLNAIVVGNAKPPDAARIRNYRNPDFTPPDVFKIAAQSGGEAFRGTKIGEAFREMIERIRSRYSIHYPAPQPAAGGFRRITVELEPAVRRRLGEIEIRARAGYYPGELGVPIPPK